MEANDGPTVLFVLGVVGVVFGFWVGGWFWGSFVYVGISWIIAGVALKLAERELTEGAFFAGLLLGIVGAILWIVIDMSRSEYDDRSWKYRHSQRRYQSIAQEDYKCGNCFWIGKPGCPRKETLINAEPCADFKMWK